MDEWRSRAEVEIRQHRRRAETTRAVVRSFVAATQARDRDMFDRSVDVLALPAEQKFPWEWDFQVEDIPVVPIPDA